MAFLMRGTDRQGWTQQNEKEFNNACGKVKEPWVIEASIMRGTLLFIRHKYKS